MLYSLNHHSTCRFEVRQALLYQLVSGLTDENGKYNYAKAVHFYPPFIDIFCSAKNYKIASALTARCKKGDITMARFDKNQKTLKTKQAKDAEKSRIWKVVVATVPPELQWYKYIQRTNAL